VQVTVLGAGSWGTTVATLACGRNPTTLWARSPDVAREVNERHTNSTYLDGFELPDGLTATSDLEEAVSRAELVVVGVPTHGFRDVLKEVAPYVHPWVPIVSLSKGFEQGTYLRMTQVIQDVLPGRPAAALTGPNLAKEIMSGCAAASVIATEDLSVAGAIQSVLRRGLFRIYTNHDVIGCEVGGALKNVVAIATGIAQGLSVGDNTRAAVISRGLSELTRLGVAMGAEPLTFAGLAGMGDLIATCVSPLSRNRTVGERLGKGERIEDILASMKMVAEGVKTAGTVMELADRHGVEMPICREIARVVNGEETAEESYRGLMLTRPGHESEPG
jgi:glycerol-3-phosphate dehydrogenase (NAD(P)+)